MNQTTLSGFLAAFFPDEYECVSLRAFAPKKAPKSEARFIPHKIATSRHTLASDKTLQAQLSQLNTSRGLYFVVNAGGDADENISRFNAWFAEDDTRSIDEQHRRLDAAPLRPSIRVETLKSVHAYWLIAGDCTEEEWRDIQTRLIGHFGGDEKIKNPSRVMRLPFFNHVHYESNSGVLSYKRVTLVEFEPECRYTLEEMQAAFAPVIATELITDASFDTSQSTSEYSSWDELHAEATRRIRLAPKSQTNKKGWTHAPGICHGSADGKAQYVSPDGAYGCHKSCTGAQVRASYGLPDRPDTLEPETNTGNGQPKAARISRFTFTTLDDLLAEPEEETAFVWDKTLPRGGFSICAAKPKVGKSTLARNLAVAISQGTDFFGRATVKGKVIYLCLEEKRAEVARHFAQMNASGTDIIIHTGQTPADALEALEYAIQEHSPALVIIDPLSRFVRVADFNNYGEVTRGLEPLIDLARSSECQCHILAVHHNGKGERESGDALLGSTGFFGAVDTLLTMKKRERVRTLETVQRYGDDITETVVHMDMETGLITAGGDLSAFQIEEHKTKVFEVIGDEPLTEKEIRERAGGNQSLISKALRALHEGDQIQRTGAGKKGDPYMYQRNSVSRFSIYTEPRNQENRENDNGKLSDEEAELAAQFEYYGAPRTEAEATAQRMFQDVPF